MSKKLQGGNGNEPPKPLAPAKKSAKKPAKKGK